MQATHLMEIQQSSKEIQGTTDICKWRDSSQTLLRPKLYLDSKLLLRNRLFSPATQTPQKQISENLTESIGNEMESHTTMHINKRNTPGTIKKTDDIDDIFALMGV